MSKSRGRIASWLGNAAEGAIVLSSLVYLGSGQPLALLAWEGVAITYLLIGGVLIWRAPAHELVVDRSSARRSLHWAWVLPVLSSAAGGYSAVIALVAKTEASSAPSELLFATAASVGIALSWLLLQVGFANIYRYICIDSDGEAIQIPGTAIPAPIDYMYFSLTIGASFATSDAAIPSLRVRRIVAVHSVVSFFYNALVVAVAFQVLQSAVSG